MAIGMVKWFDPKKGYGFITQDGGEDVFLHWRQIVSDDRPGTLWDGERVRFDLVQSDQGPQAENVAPAGL